MNAPCHLQLCRLSRFCPSVASGHNEVALSRTVRGGHCVSGANTARPPPVVMLRQQRSLELYPYSHVNLKTHAHPGTNMAATFGFFLLLSSLPLKDKTQCGPREEINSSPLRCVNTLS